MRPGDVVVLSPEFGFETLWSVPWLGDARPDDRSAAGRFNAKECALVVCLVADEGGDTVEEVLVVSCDGMGWIDADFICVVR